MRPHICEIIQGEIRQEKFVLSLQYYSNNEYRMALKVGWTNLPLKNFGPQKALLGEWNNGDRFQKFQNWTKI